MVVIGEILVLTLSVALLTLLVVLLTLAVVHVVPEGCADMRVPVIVVAMLPFVVNGYWAIQEQPAVFWSTGDLLKFMTLSCPGCPRRSHERTREVQFSLKSMRPANKSVANSQNRVNRSAHKIQYLWDLATEKNRLG